jgi:hypothetical protein
MKYWVQKPSFKVDADLLAEMKKFATSTHGSKTMERLAKELQLATAERERFEDTRQSYLRPITPRRSHSTRITQPTKARDLAIALLILEGDKYSRIHPADYISYFQQQPGENNVRDALITKQNIAYWVKHAVLRCDKLEERTGQLKFFVYTAEVTGHVDAVHITWADHCIRRNLAN